MSRIQLPVWTLLILVLATAGLAQKNSPPAQAKPAPQVTGRFIVTDGTRSLALRYQDTGRPRTFVGFIHSTCMLPAASKLGKGEPLDLNKIPLGILMTVYYVRYRVGKASQNIVLSIRFDDVPSGSALPKGVILPCFKAAGQTTH